MRAHTGGKVHPIVYLFLLAGFLIAVVSFSSISNQQPLTYGSKAQLVHPTPTLRGANTPTPNINQCKSRGGICSDDLECRRVDNWEAQKACRNTTGNSSFRCCKADSADFKCYYAATDETTCIRTSVLVNGQEYRCFWDPDRKACSN